MIWELCKREIKKYTPVSEEDLSFFDDKFRLKAYKKGDYFIREGQASREIGFIGKGAFRMFYIQGGKEINIQFFFENSMVSSCINMLRDKPSAYYIVAMEDSDILSFNYKDLLVAYERYHSWATFGRKLVEDCYLKTMDRTESLLFLDGEQRYLKLLENEPYILERVPLFQIASYLGVERESLSRLRRKIATG